MDKMLATELERLTVNAGMRREDLLDSGLFRSRRRKTLTIVAGVLALTSAATIAAFMTRLLGTSGMQALSAAIALTSGTISLVVAAHYSDDEVLGRLAGASKYLALRDAVYRLAIDPDSQDKQKRKALGTLQAEYTSLDAAYSKYFTPRTGGSSRRARSHSQRPPSFDPSRNSHGSRQPDFADIKSTAMEAVDADVRELRRNISLGDK